MAINFLLLLSLFCLFFQESRQYCLKRSSTCAAVGQRTSQFRSNKFIMMGGGRSQAELGLSKRQMFRQIREKINKAAEQPGFFTDLGQVSTELELYCKANQDGTQIGDCPFAQFVQLVLIKKGLTYAVKPTQPSNAPEWLKDKFNGKMPVLVHKGQPMGESIAIAEYLEKTFPHSSLTRQGAYSYQEVLEKTAQFFPSVKASILNQDPAKDEELLNVVKEQLDLLDGIIMSTPGKYICGIEQTLADLYLGPQLFHALVALEHFKGYDFYKLDAEPERPALENYIERLLSSEEFNDKRAYYSVDQVVYGWKTAIKAHGN